MNKVWHQRHKMPVKATLEQRIQWHAEHTEACGCRPMPPRIAAELESRRISPRTGTQKETSPEGPTRGTRVRRSGQ